MPRGPHGPQRGGIRTPPSSRIVSPLIIALTTTCSTSRAYSSGLPARRGMDRALEQHLSCVLGHRREEHGCCEAARRDRDDADVEPCQVTRGGKGHSRRRRPSMLRRRPGRLGRRKPPSTRSERRRPCRRHREARCRPSQRPRMESSDTSPRWGEIHLTPSIPANRCCATAR
jgi:hypothetical protein